MVHVDACDGCATALICVVESVVAIGACHARLRASNIGPQTL